MNLRRIKAADLPLLFEWRNDERIYRWCRQYGPIHWDSHVKWFERQSSDPKLEMFSIIRDSGSHVGVCGLTDIDMVNRRAEFSLYIAPEFQGKGYAREALIELFRWGFNALGLNRIYGESFSGNPAMKLFEKLGLELEGVRWGFYLRNGCYTNAHLYSIAAESFNYLHPLKEREPEPEESKPAAANLRLAVPSSEGAL